MHRQIANRRTGSAQRGFTLLEAAIALEPSTTPAHLNLGDVRLLGGDTAGAIAAWQQLMDVTPERAHLALERLEKLFEQQGTPQRFEEQCRRFIEARPQDWRARLALGTHLSRRGHPGQAFEPLVDALERNPHGLMVHQAIWTVLLQLDLDRTLVQRYIEAARGAGATGESAGVTCTRDECRVEITAAEGEPAGERVHKILSEVSLFLQNSDIVSDEATGKTTIVFARRAVAQGG